MKKPILFLFLFISSFSICWSQEHVPVTPQDMEAMIPSATDSLEQVGYELDAIIQQVLDRSRNNPPEKPVDWAVLIFGVIASVVGALRKWWPFLKRQWSNIKGDTPVLIFSAAMAVILSLANGDFSITGVFTQFSLTFTTAIVSYKIVLRNVWNFLAGVFKKKEATAA